MSEKVSIHNIYKWLDVKIRAFFHTKTTREPVHRRSIAVPKSKRGRPPVDFDEAEALRLRLQGWSDHRIAGRMHVAPSTVALRLRNYVPPIPPTPPELAQRAPVAAYKPPVQPVAVPRPPIVVAPFQLPSVAIPQVPAMPPARYGLDSVPAKAFFLVNGRTNAELVAHLAQPVIGIERWHETYASLPAFQAAERIWIVMNSSEDNRAFFQSIVADIWIREKCLVSVDNGSTPSTQPQQVGHWVQNVAKYKLLMDRPHDGSWPNTDVSSFEQVHNFQPLPLPSHTDKIAALCRRFEAEVDSTMRLDWRH